VKHIQIIPSFIVTVSLKRSWLNGLHQSVRNVSGLSLGTKCFLCCKCLSHDYWPRP